MILRNDIVSKFRYLKEQSYLDPGYTLSRTVRPMAQFFSRYTIRNDVVT